VSEIVVRYGDQVAVNGVSMSVAEGSTTAVVGPSGSGKSTLLRAIAGLEPVDQGSVVLFGDDCTSTPPNERHVGLMFQDHALFPHLDVAGNVAFGMKMQGQDRAGIPDRVDEVLDLVGLAGFGGRQVDALSGGEAQRVALARSLAPSPAVLMLDEPLGSLDRVLREELADELRALFQRLDLTVIHVTHDQQEAFTLASEVIVMRRGRIEQAGSPAELWQHPTSLFVADFLGHQNLWPTGSGTVLAPGPSLRILAGEEEDSLTPEEFVVEVDVVDVAFREGRHRVTAVERRPAGPAERRFVVDTDDEPPFADVLRVVVDGSRLVTFDQS
jgi:thiamine transport system ATP-binding protein